MLLGHYASRFIDHVSSDLLTGHLWFHYLLFILQPGGDFDSAASEPVLLSAVVSNVGQQPLVELVLVALLAAALQLLELGQALGDAQVVHLQAGEQVQLLLVCLLIGLDCRLLVRHLL